ncbi:TOBE domain-containing protein [Acerihabitans sp. TG2]|uniref:TOBE domain-containing protein n=1 Tax=Acerihabitans sp. TG2 TaxID=3096008 RepID=UPI002B236277|nr:TOBE domain-containing protein [Acerihabitans sp. TG2]MEA9389924.1 TOBE domain-containing protein [Acerihabitans sp. TG2]
MLTSARNQLTGTVSAIKTGAVNDEIEMTLSNGHALIATVTHSSVENLNLHQGGEAIAFIKAPWVILTAADSGLRFSARNQFNGTIKTIVTGAINSEVTVEIDPALTLVSVITKESVTGLGLQVGNAVTALVKASSIVLATRG